jgi:hypothetical protein
MLNVLVLSDAMTQPVGMLYVSEYVGAVDACVSGEVGGERSGIAVVVGGLDGCCVGDGV